MPNQAVMEKWVEALESGEYAQAKRTLTRIAPGDKDEDAGEVGNCCLGVLCDLAVKEGIIPKPNATTNRMSGTVLYYGTPGDESDVWLPRSVMEWAGLPAPTPWVEYREEVPGEDRTAPRSTSLADLNDEEGKTFPEIADLIRSNFYAKSDPGVAA